MKKQTAESEAFKRLVMEEIQKASAELNATAEINATEATADKATDAAQKSEPKKRTRPVAKLPEKKEETEAEMKNAMNAPVKQEGVTVYDAEFVKAFRKHEAAIAQGYKGATSNFLKIAFNLHWIHANEAYKTAGKENIYDYARDKFDIARGTTHGYITVAERFGRKAQESDTLCLMDEYEGYSPSQLIIMAGYTDEQLKLAEISKEMSCRNMKAALKQLATIGTADSEQEESPADVDNTADETADNSDIVDKPEPAVKPEEVTNTLISFIGADEYRSKADIIDNLILNLLTQKPDARISVCYTV